MSAPPLPESEPAGVGTPLARGAVASDTPGRLRVRLNRSHRHPHLLGQLQTQLASHPGIHDIRTNPATGSVVVQYDAGRHSSSDVVAILRDLGVVIADVLKAGGDDLPDVGHSETSETIVHALDDLDRRISLYTGGKVDLKLLFPLTMFGIGIRQAFVNGLGLADVPAYVLLWYAFDSFYKFHQQRPVTPTSAADAADDGRTTRATDGA